jgi:hypothetical protein
MMIKNLKVFSLLLKIVESRHIDCLKSIIPKKNAKFMEYKEYDFVN